MGSPVSVVVADLVMEDVEERALTTYHSPPLFWKRYVDDVCTALQEKDIKEFKKHLDSIEPSIKFTMESESNGKIAFLDTEIHHHEDGSLNTGRKLTRTNIFLLIPTTQWHTKMLWQEHSLTEQTRYVATTLIESRKRCTSLQL